MKRGLSLLIIICMLLSLSGCSGIYSNFRELERLLVIQTMGIDFAEEGVGISLASGAKSDGSSPVRLFSTGVSVTSAVAHILSYSQEQELFLSHTSHVVLGEEAAKNGINGYLSYICRSPNLRTDIPLYIVKGGTAQEAVMQVGDGSKGISEVLEAVRANVDERGDSKAFSASDLLRDLERNGSGLVCAIECSPSIQEGGTKQEGGSGSFSGTDSAESPDSTGGSGSGEEKQEKQALTAAAVGYGVIRGDRLCAYIDKEQAIGVGLLLNIVGISDIVVKDRYATPVTLELDQGSSEIKPVWAEDGSLEMLDIQIKAAANIAEIGGGGHFSEPDYEDYLTAQLETAVSERVSSVIQLSKTLQADFLGLGNIVEMDDAEKYRALGGDFASLLPGLTVRISVSGQIKHTNDIRDEKA